MDPYYDYAPTLTLTRPLALTGFLGSGADAVAQAISQLTGVPLVELDRWIEHAAGMSLSALVLGEGEARLRSEERVLLRRALEQKPAGVIALGDGALLDEESLALVKATARLVYLRVPFPDLMETLRRGAIPPGHLYPWAGHRPTDGRDVRPLFDARRPGYEAAHQVLDGEGRSTLTLARQLVEEARARAAEGHSA